MGQRTTIAVTLLTCLTLFSCGSQSDQKTKKDSTAPTEASEKARETETPNLEKAAAITKGQPGQIIITGEELTKVTGKVDKEKPLKISIETVPGLDLAGKQISIPAETVQIVKDANDDSLTETLAQMDLDKTFINLGCDVKDRKELAGLDEKKVDVSAMKEIASLKANTILLCGDKALSANLIAITAKIVILDNLKLNVVGGVESLISIRAREINMTGTSLLTSKNATKTAAVGEALPVGPTIRLTGEKLSGEGRIQIISIGLVPDAAAQAAGKLTQSSPQAPVDVPSTPATPKIVQ